MSKSQRTRRLRRRQVASQPRGHARRAGVAITGTLLSTAGLAVVPAGTQAAPAVPEAARAGNPAVGLVEDVHRGQASSSVSSIVDLGGRALMSLDDGKHGRELWLSDGSEAGTKMLVDLNTKVITSKRGTRPGSSSPNSLTPVGDLVFFSADDGVHGRELWRTDGTAAGTVRLTDIADTRGEYSYNYPSSLTDVGGTLYFALDDNVHGRELWTSDGTVAGTAMVADINTQTRRDRALGSSPDGFTAVGDTVLFTADDGLTGRELWKTDGTAAGTALVADLNTQASTGYYADRPSSSSPRYFAALGDALYFSADDGVNGRELWTSDGTTAGTEMVTDIRPGTTSSEYYTDPRPASSRPTGITAVGDALYFSADDGEHGTELWTSDGTAAGTGLVADINPSNKGYSYFGYYGLTEMDGTLFFGADDGSHGLELWASDGTAAGTRLVKDIATGSARGRARSSSPRELTVVGDDLYFVARNAAGVRQLWTSDGTTGGTRVFAQVGTEGPGGYSYGPNTLTEVGGELFFGADDGVYGRELWSTADAARSHPRVRSTAKPQIAGEVVAGGVLTVSPGSWMPAADLTHTYQWYVGGRAVKTANRQRFRPGSSDVGKMITVRVITMKDGYRGAVAYSVPTTKVVDEPLVNLARPAAVGDATVGKTLTATRGRWSVRNLTFRYRWSVGGRPVRGADARTFRLPASAAGKKVVVRVTAVRPAGAKSAVSKPRSIERR